ncbi:hypothetical protein A3D00_04895 [Candidatus Woesebacteria bacterium RIFCSPHIGHO2_02_FULL_38_9]|uniref:Nucleotidyl transferase AbiEii/AbiGii toxin family protein n=1 Tax=Candidatus Woesebacteria bacterium RIFCSPHIGHO2_01_FULL_39_28 TaxID=1802496 RepID=A0A1F7Y9V5_9BACT|nr:MAG: hypothetical protein A2627_03585 [Candidatus Woesebacteria bacterium RIFCSPHIGHO2_01_FULL_39_28]OGM34987.1 MAG: hypothetical protein A3D00_04895 [Candidatus Woesebacteria bacterium RIFCSPHIGHO2_02_FULL_38_9]OGM57428.1 MAG: hypothetical protein A3A50_05860 [Candidatus Woesebacteria bacterium RIFCSPLOWO2_01_FULL_38_20]
MNYYHDLITQKSWQVLKSLSGKFKFILIGGWATYLYTKALKSKDIDMVIGFSELEKIRTDFDVTKNDRLKKYEARREEVEIDIYVPYYSNPGIPAEEIGKWTQSIEAIVLPKSELLILLKQHAFKNRKGTPKGRKDFLDIISLLTNADFNWDFYKKMIHEYSTIELLKELEEELRITFEVPELDLNRHNFSRLKKSWLQEFSKLEA